MQSIPSRHHVLNINIVHQKVNTSWSWEFQWVCSDNNSLCCVELTWANSGSHFWYTCYWKGKRPRQRDKSLSMQTVQSSCMHIKRRTDNLIPVRLEQTSNQLYRVRHRPEKKSNQLPLQTESKRDKTDVASLFFWDKFIFLNIKWLWKLQLLLQWIYFNLENNCIGMWLWIRIAAAADTWFCVYCKPLK